LKNEVSSLKNLINSYEERNLNIADLEKKIRLQHSKHQAELKSIEEKYLEKIKRYKKKLKQYEEMLRKGSKKDVTKIYDKPPDTDRGPVHHQYNRCGSMTERLKKDDISVKIDHFKHVIDKKISEINDIKFTIDSTDEQHMKDKLGLNYNHLTTNMKSDYNFDTVETVNTKVKRKVSEQKEVHKTTNQHVRTNSIAGTQTSSRPSFHLNLQGINKKTSSKENTSMVINNYVKNTNNPKSKEQLASIINIYTANMNNIKAKEINLRNVVSSHKVQAQKTQRDNRDNPNTARTFTNNNKQI